MCGFQTCKHQISSIDAQPSHSGGLIVFVTGQLLVGPPCVLVRALLALMNIGLDPAASLQLRLSIQHARC